VRHGEEGAGGEDLNEGGLRMSMRGRDEKGGRGMKKEGGEDILGWRRCLLTIIFSPPSLLPLLIN